MLLQLLHSSSTFQPRRKTHSIRDSTYLFFPHDPSPKGIVTSTGLETTRKHKPRASIQHDDGTKGPQNHLAPLVPAPADVQIKDIEEEMAKTQVSQHYLHEHCMLTM
jgi:hypothetical protein